MDSQTPKTITVWHNGKFSEEAPPPWWDAVQKDMNVRNRSAREQEYGPGQTIGHPQGWCITAFSLHADKEPRNRFSGRFVYFRSLLDIRAVWVPTDADYLDLLTTRVPAWLALDRDR
jgi:hypothetical protein